MNSELKNYLSYSLNAKITGIYQVSGGDISEAFKIITPHQNYFIKINSAETLHMFQIESNALKHISETKTIKTPEVITVEFFENIAFLLMEFVESKTPTAKDYEKLGFQLAELHKCSSENFGWIENNFIGTLPQSNTEHKSWNDFYVNERLKPQLQLAQSKHLLSKNECPTHKFMLEKLEPLLQNVKPSFLHGDLWGGNFLISSQGEPYLIEPANY